MQYEIYIQTQTDWKQIARELSEPRNPASYANEKEYVHDIYHDIVKAIKGGEMLSRDISTLIEFLKAEEYEILYREDGRIAKIVSKTAKETT